MTTQEIRLFKLPSVTAEVTVRGGIGELVVLLPGLGRLMSDFDQLSATLVENGYTTAAINHPGIGRSTQPGENWNLHDLANVIAEFIEEYGLLPAHVCGHAYGNRVARCLTTDRPELVRSVTVVAAGGKFPPKPEALTAWTSLDELESDDPQRVDLIRKAFFAPGNDPTPLLTGQSAQPAVWLSKATNRTNVEEWWTAGESTPMLVVQGLQDAVAPPENGRDLKEKLGDRVELVEINNAGHALLMEQPEQVASALISFLSRH